MAVRNSDEVLVVVVGGAVGVGAALWAGGALSALVCGHPVPGGHPLAGLLAFGEMGDPSAAWGFSVGPAFAYWVITLVVLASAITIVLLLSRVLTSLGADASGHGSRADGLAGRGQVRRAAGVRVLARKSDMLRPSLSRPRPTDVGYRLGRASGVACWASVEDSLVVLGPPRSGKGLHLVIPAILDAPGAVVTTSTRPDNLAATIKARERVGPVAVFDPQGLANGVAATTRWSPIRGCEVPRVAMARARALCPDPAKGIENGSFWTQQCYIAVRCLLHAAALDHRPPVELYRWSLSALVAEQAAEILTTHPDAAPAWSTALEAILGTDPRQRDSVWAMVANTFAALADPNVLDAVSPASGQQFDPDQFLRERGSLYLLGTASDASATANLVAAFIEDIVECARHLAAASSGARLDPPLAVILDEAANYPMPSLPALMSDGGGTGLTTMVVLQSLAQARARWGRHEAAAIWDAAIVKLILGGSGSAEDLRDLSALIGTRTERRINDSWGRDGHRSSSTSTHEVPILDTGRLRTLPFGKAVLLLRSAPPILLHLQPWTRRRDAASLTGERAEMETTLRGTAGETAA
ncbi:MAG TPA: TraM recognition domain-containing protein [Mycobacterium sp.]|nr:TraM recognition domain-containing protein [Mycobacterium sp.]